MIASPCATRLAFQYLVGTNTTPAGADEIVLSIHLSIAVRKTAPRVQGCVLCEAPNFFSQAGEDVTRFGTEPALHIVVQMRSMRGGVISCSLENDPATM